jgi:hypothetical protein
MTKIKNFRITLRPRDMARWLKKERGMETTPELELAVEQLIKESKPWISPAAVYTTLTRQIAEKTTSLSFPNKSIAVSVVAISIGTALHEQRLATPSDPIRDPLLAALEQEALAQAVQFAVRLIQDQAKEEDCEMSAPVTAEDVQTASALATLVGIQRIGINLDAVSSELPPHARVAWLFWTPVGKGSAKRPEKVAV